MHHIMNVSLDFQCVKMMMSTVKTHRCIFSVLLVGCGYLWVNLNVQGTSICSYVLNFRAFTPNF